MITPVQTREVLKADVRKWEVGGQWRVAAVQPRGRKAKGKVTMERLYSPYDELLPAAQTAQVRPHWRHIVPGRERTSYFYRKMASTFLRDALQFRRCGEYFPGQYKTYKELALMYLASFKKMKGQVA